MKIGIIVNETNPKAGGEKGLGRYYCRRFKKYSKQSTKYIAIYGVTGKLPNEIQEYSGFIITGSGASANDNEEWIQNLRKFISLIKQYNELRVNKIRVIGICFGHQLVAKLYGGIVGKNPSRCLELGGEDVFIDKPFQPHARVLFGNKCEKLKIMEFHNEQVLVKPQSAKLLGRSKSCENEILLYSDWLLTLQGHPEYTDELLSAFLAMTELSLEQAKSMVEERGSVQSEELMKLVCNFVQKDFH